MSSHASLQSSSSTTTSASTAVAPAASPSSLTTVPSAKLSKTQQRFLRAFPEFTDELVMAVAASLGSSSSTPDRPSSMTTSTLQQPTLATPPQTPPESGSLDPSDSISAHTGRHDSYNAAVAPDNAMASSLTAPTPMFCLDDFTCALQRDYLWQGTLFVTLTHLCFFGRHFTKTIHVKIHFADLVSIDKEKKLGMIPNTLRIRVRTVCQNNVAGRASEVADQEAASALYQETMSTPSDGACAEPTKEYVLTSFLSRDQAFAAIERHWNIHKQLQVHQQALLARHKRSIDQLRSRQGQLYKLHQHQEQDSGTWSASSSSEEDGESRSPRIHALPVSSGEPRVSNDKEPEHEHSQSRPCSTADHALSEPRVSSQCLLKLEHVHRLQPSASNSSLRARRKAQRTYSVITSEADSPNSERMDEGEDDSDNSSDESDDDDGEMGCAGSLDVTTQHAHTTEKTFVFASKTSESDATDKQDSQLVDPAADNSLDVRPTAEPSVHEDTPVLVVQESDLLTSEADGASGSLLVPPKRSNSTGSTSSIVSTLSTTTTTTTTTTPAPSHRRDRVTSISSAASIMSDRSPRLIGPPKLISPSLTTTKVSHSSSTIQSTSKEGEPQNMTIHRREGTQGALLLEDENYLASSYASSTMSVASGGLSHPRYHHGTTTATTTTTTVETRGVPWAGSQISLISTISNSSLESLSSTLPSRHHAPDVSRMPDLKETEEVLLDEEIEGSGAEDVAGQDSLGEEASDDEDLDDSGDESMDELEQSYPSAPVDCGCSRHYKNMVLSRVVPLSVAMCFEILFSAQGEGENDRLACDVHRVKDGSTEFNIQPWKHASPEDEVPGQEWENKSRDLEYSVSFKVPMLAKTSTACYEVQKILKHTPELILVHSESRTPNVPYGEHFSTVSQICLSFEAKGQTRIKMFTEVKFKKSLMWSGRVEAGSLEGSGGFWKAFIEQLDEFARDPAFLARQEQRKEAVAEKRKQERAAAVAEAKKQKMMMKKKEAALAKALAAANEDRERHPPPPTMKRTRFQTPPSSSLASRRSTMIEQSEPAAPSFQVQKTHIPIAALSNTSHTGPAASKLGSPHATMPAIVPGGLLATLAAAAAANAATRPLSMDHAAEAPTRSLLSLQHLRQLQQQQQLQQIAQQNYKPAAVTTMGGGGRSSFDSTSSSDSSTSSNSQTSSSGSLSDRKRKPSSSTTTTTTRPSSSHEQLSQKTSVSAGGFAAATAFFSLGRSSAKKQSSSSFLNPPTSSGATGSLSSSPQPSPSLAPAATAAMAATTAEPKGFSSSAISAVSALLQHQQQQQGVEATKEIGGSLSSLSTLASTSSPTAATSSTTSTSTSTSSVTTLLAPLLSADDFMTKLQSTWSGWMTDVARLGSQFSMSSQKNGAAATASEVDGTMTATATNGSGQGETTLLDAGAAEVGDAKATAHPLSSSSQDMETASEDSEDVSDVDSASLRVDDEDDALLVEENTHSSSSTTTKAANGGPNGVRTVDTAHRAMSSVLFLSVIVALMVSALNVLKLMTVVSSMVQVVEIRHQWMVTHPSPMWQPRQQQQQQQHFHAPSSFSSSSTEGAGQSDRIGEASDIPPTFQARRGPSSQRPHHHIHHHHHHYYHNQDGSIVIKRQKIHSSTTLDSATVVPDAPPLASSVSTFPSSATTATKASVKQRDQTLHDIRARTKMLRLEMEVLKRQLEEHLV
ncbi:Protein Aster-C [Actinomortierella ambigua]|nr:Protein Aster-C [Actinomortierella ambigua]